MKNALLTIALTVGIIILLAVTSSLIPVPPDAAAAAPADSAGAALGLLMIGAVDAALLAVLSHRSTLPRLKRAVVLAACFFGAVALLGQIETLLFLDVANVPASVAVGSLVMWAIITPLAVGYAAKLYGGPGERGALVLSLPLASLLKRGALLSVVYYALYSVFGYFVAWRTPELLAYYHGVDEGSFGAHMLAWWKSDPWMVLVQLARGAGWTAIVAVLVGTTRGSLATRAVLIGALLALPLNIQHLLPNPWMPEVVRITHMIETASSTFLFGVIAVVVLGLRLRERKSATAPL